MSSGGWITADNVDQHFNAEGNWIGGDEQADQEPEEPLGTGAGHVRGRDEAEGGVNGGEVSNGLGNVVNGHGTTYDEQESKRTRLD